MIKWFIIILICLCVIYAPIELSRLILASELNTALIIELCGIWVFYLMALTILSKEVR